MPQTTSNNVTTTMNTVDLMKRRLRWLRPIVLISAIVSAVAGLAILLLSPASPLVFVFLSCLVMAFFYDITDLENKLPVILGKILDNWDMNLSLFKTTLDHITRKINTWRSQVSHLFFNDESSHLINSLSLEQSSPAKINSLLDDESTSVLISKEEENDEKIADNELIDDEHTGVSTKFNKEKNKNILPNAGVFGNSSPVKASMQPQPESQFNAQV